jgi:hypothetical protein
VIETMSTLELIEEALRRARAAHPRGPVARLLGQAFLAERTSSAGAKALADVERQAQADLAALWGKDSPPPKPAARGATRCEDLKGRRFGPWTVVRYVSPGKATPLWLCRCRCTHERLVNGAQLRNRPPVCEGCGRRS